MSLRTYAKKRDFGVTPEPRSSTAKKGAPQFVVQLHHARARHYDFRLQVGNALKSWAVPKGPSFDPSVKRLAIQVEDHPIGYAKFEGDIPAGQYGAGHVDIFDRGTWSTADNARAQLAKGHLEFELHGERLHGSWHLVRSRREARQPQWLLVKAHDQFASTAEADDLLQIPPRPLRRTAKQAAPAPASTRRSSKVRRREVKWSKRALDMANATKEKMNREAFEPALARSSATPPQGKEWLHETKWDGYRILATMVNGKARLWSRNALDWTSRLPVIVTALEALPVRDAQFDGELIVANAHKDSFNELQAVLSGERAIPLVDALFDLLHIDGVGLKNCTLVDRKRLLQALLLSTPSPALRYSEHHIGDGATVFEVAAKSGLEGIMSKRVASKYRPGRGNDWVKVKSVLSDEFAIVGYTKGRGSRVGFGALLLGRSDKRGGWDYAGRIGSGFSGVLLKRLGQLLPTIRRDTPPVNKASLIERDTGKPQWIEPKYVVEVYYRGMGKEGLLRQASLKTLREDKSASDLQRDPDQAVRAKPAANKNSVAAPRSRARRAATGTASLNHITHPDRVVFPEDGYTKLQVAEYYEKVLPWLLPQIANRPLSLVRCPGGANQPCFFQKHHSPQIGGHVRSLPLTDSRGAKVNFLYVDDAESIRELVQMNTLEFHPWGSTIDALESADRLIFDLDPGPGVTWRKIVAAADLLREFLAGIDLRSFVKFSGGKGLHVAVPLHPAPPWETAKQFCRQIAAALAKERPRDFIDVATKSRRAGRIFVDYLRNSRGATSVAAYSLRARPGAPVAMPVQWPQTHEAKNPTIYTLANTPAYLSKRDDDPWAAMNAVRQSLPQINAVRKSARR